MSVAFVELPGTVLHAKRLDRAGAGFVVAAMFTANMQRHAERLKQSLDEMGLDYALYRVPSVHRSISPRGSDEIAFSKPNFIHNMLEAFQRPILYVDADIVVRQYPTEFAAMVEKGIDFAIYNWIADPANDAYLPFKLGSESAAAENRFYKFSHSIDLFDPQQLASSGAVQFYSNTEFSRTLLLDWLRAIEEYPSICDDQLLDLAFNFGTNHDGAAISWLDKSYCRYAWWIHVCPVMDHPDFPADKIPSREFSTALGRERFKIAELKPPPLRRKAFPRDCLIDLKHRALIRIVGGKPIPVAKFDTELWLAT